MKTGVSMFLALSPFAQCGIFDGDGRYLGVPIRKGNPERNKNLKEFNINGKTVWAINEKNAIRKANKEEPK